jgi:glutamine---fructose-6-phosphate transaminase (isomerizing)
VPADLRVIDGPYLRDLLDQPRALADTLAGLDRPEQLQHLAARLRRREFQQVVLTGMGSSFHALHPLNLQLIENGFTAVMVETSELIHYQARLLDPKTLIIAVSQSGQSAEIVRLLEISQKSAMIAVTNTAESPLAENSTAVLLTKAGSEFSVSCKTYVAALMALQWLADALCGRDLSESRHELSRAEAEAAGYLSHWQDHVKLLAEKLERVRNLFFVGRGASLAGVGTGALIVKESAHFPAEGMSSAAFRHGPFEMLNEEIRILVFAGDDKTRNLNQRLFADIQQRGGRAELIGETASLACFRLAQSRNRTRAILEILPVQMITLALAALAGREPGKFELASKITTTE